MKFSSFLATAIVAAGFASTASATSACSSGTTDVTNGGTGTYSCTIGNLTFSNFGVSTTGALLPTMVGLATAGTGLFGSDADLEFQFSAVFSDAPTDIGDLLITYTVTGGIEGVDTNIQGVPTGSGAGVVGLLETVCSAPLVLGNCPSSATTYTLSATSTGGSDAVNAIQFAPLGTAYIKKDISFNGASLSEFNNSQLVPEPMAFSLMGAGLLGLGLLGRRLRK